MGKKKKNSGTAAGEKAKQKNIQAQSQRQDPDSLESSLRKRSRFSTEHLEQLEALYREGLNLEDEILKDAEPETTSEPDAELWTTPEPDGELWTNPEMEGADAEPETTPEPDESVAGTEKGRKASEKERSKETKPEEAAYAETMSDGISLEKLTSAGITLGELSAAGITEGKYVTDEEVPQGRPSPAEKCVGNSSSLSASEGTEAGEGKLSASEGIEAGEGKLSAAEGTEGGDKTAVEGTGGGDITAVEGTEGGDKTAVEDTGGGDKAAAESTGGGDKAAAEGTGDGDKAEAEGTGGGDKAAAEGTGGGDMAAEGTGGGDKAAAEDIGAGEAADADASGNGSDGPLVLRRKSGLSGKTGIIQIAVFFIALFGISIVGLCMPMRPTESQIEKRTLTEFPEFTWESFLSGDYTDQISTWYADTFPFRENLLSWYSDFKKLFGIQGDEVYIGDVIVADDIPDIPDEDETSSVATDTDATDTDAASAENQTETTAETPETTTEVPTETTTEAPTETTTEETTEAETEAQTTTSDGTGSSVVGEQIGSVYIYGDQAFSVYGFSLEMSDNYAKMISLAAEELAGKATVYNILVPLSYGIQLDSDLWESMGWSDEEKAIKYMYSQMSDDVKTVSIYQTLLEHKDEYIYFRTDHHWTALGAYYAYQCFAGVKGITANALDSFETMTFENYLGALYSQSNESEALANNPDTITAYVPHGTNRITITQKDGSILDWRVIYDVTSWRKDSKYSCFIGGDNPFSVIENPEITDGSSVLLVKESFGNAFAPFLVDHYQYVYIIDFRYYSGHLEEVVDTYGIQDVIFMNNLNSAGGSLQNYLQTFIEPEETGTQE